MSKGTLAATAFLVGIAVFLGGAVVQQTHPALGAAMALGPILALALVLAYLLKELIDND